MFFKPDNFSLSKFKFGSHHHHKIRHKQQQNKAHTNFTKVSKLCFISFLLYLVVFNYSWSYSILYFFIAFALFNYYSLWLTFYIKFQLIYEKLLSNKIEKYRKECDLIMCECESKTELLLLCYWPGLPLLLYAHKRRVE